MIKHLNLAQFEYCGGTQECGIDTHSFESHTQERILYSQEETKRLNSPKSVVSPFNEIKIKCVGKASGIES
jgi:hypothetical protein